MSTNKHEPIAYLSDAVIVETRDRFLPSQGEAFDCIAFARAIEDHVLAFASASRASPAATGASSRAAEERDAPSADQVRASIVDLLADIESRCIHRLGVDISDEVQAVILAQADRPFVQSSAARVNDELVAALEKLIRVAEGYLPRSLDNFLFDARAAIASAKEQS